MVGPKAVLNAIQYPLRFLSGDDVFISYSRADGISYAEGLASELAKRSFSCRVDLWDTAPGADLPRSLKRALRWSKMLVVIGTSGAVESPHVGFEIHEFLTTRGILIPIGFGHTIEAAPWFEQIRGLPITDENEPAALTAGKPSIAVLSRIENAVKFRRRNQRIRDLSAVGLTILLSLVALSAIAGWDAARQTKEAARRRTEAASAAEQARQQQQLAHTAEEQRAASELRAKAASDQEQKARRSAAEQQRRAELARQAAELEERGTSILRQFQSGTGELEALQAAIGLGRALTALVPHRIPVSEFPASSPVMALNTILAGIREETRLSTGGSGWDSLAFSPDGGRLAIIKNDDRFVGGGRSIWIWETAGKPLWHCAIPGGTAISTLEFDNANRGVFAAARGGVLMFWDASCTPPHTEVGPGGRSYVVGGPAPDPPTQLSDAAAKAIEALSRRIGYTGVTRVHPARDLVLASTAQGTIQAWRGAGWVPFFDSHGRNIQDFRFTGDGRYIVLEFRGGSIQVLQLSGAEVAHWTTADSSGNLWMSPVGSQFATASAGVVRVWDATGELQTQFTIQNQILDGQFTEDGTRLAVVAFDTVRFFDLKGQPLFQLAGHVGAVRRLLIAPGGGQAVTAGADGTVRVWDLSERPLLRLVGPKSRVLDWAFLPDQDAIVTATQDGNVTFWNRNGEQLRKWHASGRIDRAKISPDRKKIVLIYDAKVEVRDLDGRIIAASGPNLDKGSSSVLQAAFSRDGSGLALSRAGGFLEIRNLADGRRSSQSTEIWIYGLAFDSTGSRIAATLGETLAFFSLNGIRTGQLDTGHRLLDVSFGSDGRYLATAGADGVVGLWTSTGRFVQNIFGHSARVLTICFSPDSQMIATAGEDQAVRLWDLKGRQLAVFSAPVTSVTGEASGGGFIGPPVNFSPDGQWLGLGGRDGVVRIWPIDGLSKLIDRGQHWLGAYTSAPARKPEWPLP